MEEFILKGHGRYKILAPRWRAMTGKRLLRSLEHEQRSGRVNMTARRAKGGQMPVASLSGLEEEGDGSESSSEDQAS